MDNIEQQKIEEYLIKLQNLKKEELLDEIKELKNKHSYSISSAICYEANRVYNPNKFNVEKLNEIVMSSLEKIPKEYEKQMDDDLQNTFENNRKNKKIENILLEITNKIITDVNTHIKFRESLESLNYGRGYHNVSNARRIREIEDLEVYIRQCVKKEINKLNEQIEMIYDDILLEYNKKAKNFLDNISTYKDEQSKVSQNEAAFIDTPIRTLDPNGIFDDTPVYQKQEPVQNKPLGILDPNCIFDDYEDYESENAKRFL